MTDTNRFEKYGISIPEILIPAKNIDLKAWAVVACDQYTQEKAYWERAQKAREGKPSALSLILPEAYLDEKDARIPAIHAAMKEYARGGVFAPSVSAPVYVERATEFERTRRGLVTAIDLDAYDWDPQKKALIRATESTIVERIPPRMDIRRNAPLEIPHIMLLVNDPRGILVEGCAAFVRKNNIAAVYDTELMLSAGHITGYALYGEDALALIENALAELAKENTQQDGSVFLFAAGDGNHSLASAKAVWEEMKKDYALGNHPARYALVEIVNIYDEGLNFEPIHRVVFNARAQDVVDFIAAHLCAKTKKCASQNELIDCVQNSAHTIGFAFRATHDEKLCFIALDAPLEGLAVSALQPVLDEYLKNHAECSIDYIHGTDELFRLARNNNSEARETVSIMLPPIAKDCFFSTISETGVLPRKSFSMGEASEKRFYFECRKLFAAETERV